MMIRLKRHFVLLFLTIPVSAFGGTVDLTEYDLVFSDEFNSRTLDAEKWTTRHLWGSFTPINAEEQYYVDSLDFDRDLGYTPFEFTDSSLIIKADEITSAATAPEQPAPDDEHWTANPNFNYNVDYSPEDRKYFSGIISSNESFNFTHGYAETRAKIPAGKGLWSAFWLLTSKYVEDVPELDIMEAIGEYEDEVNHTLHYFDIENNWELVSSPTFKTTGENFTQSFHTYGVLWEPKKITWFVDDVAVKVITEDDFLIAKQSMYLIANLAVGGNWPGSPDSTTIFPAKYELDYIRVFKKKPVNNITPSVLASEYQLMFSDEFNGNSLDPSKWNTNYLWGPFYQINKEQQYYVDKFSSDATYSVDPFEVSNGSLKITAAPVAAADLPDQPPLNDPFWQENPSHQYNADYKQADGWNPNYTSGVLTSYDSFKFVNGYVEARIKVPEGAGLWPAFWLLNGYYVGPMPEIDIMELQGEAPNVAHHSYHYHDTNGRLVSSAKLSTLPNNESFAGDFHTFGVQWDRGKITWYVDGVKTRILEGPEVSTQLMYILLNLAVGGNFVGDVDPQSLPAVMEIDYIRSYQRKSSTLIQPPPDNTAPINSTSIGSANNGIAVAEAASGEGYILFSETDVFDRFSARPPYRGNASNLVAVMLIDNQWHYNNNARWIPFSPEQSDLLIANVDFSARTINDMSGQNLVVSGINAGYASGNLAFSPDTWAGTFNTGEYGASGSYFIRNETSNTENPSINIGSVNKGIAVTETASGEGYILFSETNVFDRFSAKPPFRGNASNLVAVIFSDNQWHYNNNARWIPFTPEQSDLLVANVDFSAHSINDMSGQNLVVNGINAGYASGNLAFSPDTWAGAFNTGEYGASGSFFIRNDTNTTDNPFINIGSVNKGIAVTETASGEGYILFSETDVFDRFSEKPPFRGNSSNLVAVKLIDNQWHYNNNARWISFTPEQSDLLVANVDFSAHTINDMSGQDLVVNGINAGYASGNLAFSPDTWAGAFNTGEYGASGSFLTRN